MDLLLFSLMDKCNKQQEVHYYILKRHFWKIEKLLQKSWWKKNAIILKLIGLLVLEERKTIRVKKWKDILVRYHGQNQQTKQQRNEVRLRDECSNFLRRSRHSFHPHHPS
jgi:hypothetical protein